MEMPHFYSEQDMHAYLYHKNGGRLGDLNREML